MPDEMKRSDKYHNSIYSWMQVRDCVAGSNFVKRRQEIYLPMPSGMIGVAESSSSTSNSNSSDLSIAQMPWYHRNPAYRAYLHRARFPDITGSILRGMTGIITKVDPEVNLPSALKSLEDVATVCNKSLIELYGFSIGEVMQTGKLCYVVDVNTKGEVKIAVYSAERNIDWGYSIVDGAKVLTRCVFIEEFGSDDSEETTIEYKIVNGIAVYQRYKAGKEFGEESPIVFKGKTSKTLPIFFAGSSDNNAELDIIPLLGVSDIALTIYRKDADLSQAQYMTCNPTLFIFGVSDNEKPTMIGSTVTVCVSNPNASAEYPATDTTALDHVQKAIESLYGEAISMGAQALGIGSRAAESAEALSIREAASGATLITVVDLVSKAISDALNFAAKWAGKGEAEFEGSLDFADKSLSPQQLTAIVSSWVQGAISHDTVLDKLRDSNIVSPDVTNAQEKGKILSEQEDITVTGGDGDKDE